MRRGMFGIVLAVLLMPVTAGAGEPLFVDPPKARIAVERGDDTLTLSFENRRWWVNRGERPRQLASTPAVQAFVRRLSGVRTERPVARYGTPREGAFDGAAVISWDGVRVEMGGASRIPGLIYVRLKDGSLHLARPFETMPDPATLVDRRLFPDGLASSVEIDVTGPGILLHATRTFGPWRITAPDPTAADSGRIEAWLGRIEALTGDPQESAPEGDRYEVVITPEQGELISLALLPEGHVEMGGMVFRTDPAPGSMVPTVFDWMEKVVAQVPAAEITGLKIRHRERSITLTRRGRSTWEEKESGVIYRSWVTELFPHLAPLTAIGLYAGDPAALGEPWLECRFWRGDEIAATLEFWNSPEGRWWVRGGGVYVYEVPEALPSHLSKLF